MIMSKFQVHDYRPYRRWRHLDILQYKCYIMAKIPRLKGKDGKVKSLEIPWADSHERHSYLFERAAIDLSRRSTGLPPKGPKDSFVRPEGIPSPKGCPWHGKGLLWRRMPLAWEIPWEKIKWKNTGNQAGSKRIQNLRKLQKYYPIIPCKLDLYPLN